MWLSRKNSINSKQASPIRRSPSSFNRQSFKNIEDLIADDDNNVSSSNDFSDLNSNQQQQQLKKPSPPQPSSPSPTTSAAAKRSVFHRVRIANQFARSFASRPKPVSEKSLPESNNATPSPSSESNNATPSPSSAQRSEKSATAQSITIPGAENRIVVYTTSLRVVRPTFEACRSVRSILQGFRVAVEQRDLTMDSSFRGELQKIISKGGPVKELTLPEIFIGGRYVGGAEELRQLNETGELKKLTEKLPAVSRGVCDVCGDYSFIICNECNGSRKCYKEKGGIRSCTLCNENGLIRCPSCWSN